MAPGTNTAAVATLRNSRVKQQEGVMDADAAAAVRKAERRRLRGAQGGVLLPLSYQYRIIPVRKKQKAFLDLDLAAQMTNTIFSGLENLVPNSYCNALWQVSQESCCPKQKLASSGIVMSTKAYSHR